jgi:hypothetical protein
MSVGHMFAALCVFIRSQLSPFVGIFMIHRSLVALAVSSALAAMSHGAMAQTTGPSSSAAPYLLSTDVSTTFTSIFTTGNSVGGYRMAGLPDGLGAYDNGNGTFTVLMNHEINPTVSSSNTGGAVRAHGGTGAFISEWVINKSDLSVVSGGDLIQSVYGWNSATQQSNSVANASTSFSRFCSADLAPTSAFYNPITGLGTQSRIFLTGEEGSATGWGTATVASGADKGKSYILGKLNLATNGSGGTAVGAWENLVANPIAQNKTVVMGPNDGGTGIMNGAMAVYVGTKQTTGSEIDKAGLTNGVTKFVNVAGNATEISNATTRATGIANGTRFSLSDTASTAFARPEDGAWSNDGKTFYFVTTDRLDNTDLAGGTQKGGTRLWGMSFDDIGNVDAGGTINVLVDSSAMPGGLGVNKPNMFDNMSVNKDGTITLLEDVGGASHNGKVWVFNPADKSMKLVAKFDPVLFGDVNAAGTFTAGTHTNDEESSGVIDITDVLGRNDGKQYSLLTAQDHASAASLGLPDPTAMVQGGQLLVMATAPVPEPETYAMLLAGLGMLGAVARRRNRK